MSYESMKNQFKQWIGAISAEHKMTITKTPKSHEDQKRFENQTTNGFPIYDPDPKFDSVYLYEDSEYPFERLHHDLIEIFEHLQLNYSEDQLLHTIDHVHDLNQLYDGHYAQIVINAVAEYLAMIDVNFNIKDLDQFGNQLIDHKHNDDLENRIKAIHDHRLIKAVAPIQKSLSPIVQPQFKQAIQNVLDQYQFKDWYRKAVNYQFGTYLKNKITRELDVTQTLTEPINQLETIDEYVNYLYITNQITNLFNRDTPNQIKERQADDKYDPKYPFQDPGKTDSTAFMIRLTMDETLPDLIEQQSKLHPNVDFKNPLVDLGIKIAGNEIVDKTPAHAKTIELDGASLDWQQIKYYYEHKDHYLYIIVFNHQIEDYYYYPDRYRVEHLYALYRDQMHYNYDHQNDPNYWSNNIADVKHPYFKLKSQTLI